jgi:hypothetical protein
MLLNMLPIFTQFRDWMRQIGHRSARALILALAALAGLVLLVLALPPVIDLSRASWTRMAEVFRGSTAGFIFVESPEVYTRQRLVNDRNLQDAWLRRELEKVDDAANSFIDRTESVESYLRAMVTLAEAGGPDSGAAKSAAGAVTDPDQALKDLPVAEVPFGTEFALRAAVRDKIRQLILENALDDRHDLSGNTILGLKFDTSVIPGPNTTDYPAVFVRMADTPLDRLQADDSIPSSLSKYLLLTRDWNGQDPSTPEEIGLQRLAKTFRDYFQDWNDDLDGRIRQYLSDHPPASTGAASVLTRRLLDGRLCSTDGDAPNGRLRDQAPAALQTILETGDRDRVFQAVGYVLRLDRIDEQELRDGYLAAVRNSAEKFCLLSLDSRSATIGSFLSTAQAVPLPLPWGEMFSLLIEAQIWTHGEASPQRQAPPSAGYSASLLMQRPATAQIELLPVLRPLKVRLRFVDEADVLAEHPLGSETVVPRDALYATGWSPLACRDSACRNDGYAPWIDYLGQNHLFPVVSRALDVPEVKAIWSRLEGQVRQAAESGAAPEFCLYRSTGSGLWVEGSYDSPDWDRLCAKGLPQADEFELGAFNFVQRMARVESYTYAAFPKGDVSGVVTETTRRADASGAVAGPGGLVTGAIGAGDSRRLLETRAAPSMVNFALGQRYSNHADEAGPDRDAAPDRVWNFDFGWAIVKDGRMEPMLASQVVLISVPGYTDSLELETWQGFLDPRRMPLDRSGPFAGLDLDARIEALMPTFEKRTIRVNLPPDYSALDGLMTGSSVVRGPAIDARRLVPRDMVTPASIACEGPDRILSLVIPGERLWRSTTATLDGMKAGQIEVMPDMRGILARFKLPDGAAIPTAPELQVWTSEGNDSIRLPNMTVADFGKDCAAAGPARP